MKTSITSAPKHKIGTAPYFLEESNPLIKYKGETLLSQSNDNTIWSSVYCYLSKILLVNIVDVNSKLSSVYQFNVDSINHGVLTGKDCLLSVQGSIIKMYII